MGPCLGARLEMIFSTGRLKEEMGAHLEGRLEMLQGPPFFSLFSRCCWSRDYILGD